MNAHTRLTVVSINSNYERGVFSPEIASLDLTLIKEKLIERALSGREITSPPVALDVLDQAIEDYKGYLYLNLRYPGFPIAPSYDIDEVWHQHILFTRKYAADCQVIFGEMRHHVPHFGRDSKSPEQDVIILDNTRDLWKQEFGYVPDSYEGMTALTSDNGWSGNVNLIGVDDSFWETQASILGK